MRTQIGTLYKTLQLALMKLLSIDEEMSKLSLMKSKILAQLFHLGMNNGDVRAFKILLDNIESTKQNNASTQNFIQINNTILNQQAIESLNEDQLKEIEAIVQGEKKL